MVTGDAAEANRLLKSAKKVAVFIEVGTPVVDAYYLPDFARAKKQISEKLTKAGLVAVANPDDADIVIVVHEVYEGTTPNDRYQTVCIGDKLDVFKGGKAPSESDTPIFSVNEYCLYYGRVWPLYRAMDKLINAMKR
jgi:phenylpyruvate tautomerase PptA (4-oxalocrotonate tautomerase family)